MKQVRFYLFVLSILMTCLAIPVLASDTSDSSGYLEDTPLLDQAPLAQSVPVTIVEEELAAPGSCPLGQNLKVAKIRCKRTASGAAGGTYGGTSISLFCQGDASSVEFCASGEEWNIRMGSENGPLAVDCFYTGSGRVIGEFCDSVHFQVH